MALYDKDTETCAYKLADNEAIKYADVKNAYRCILDANIKNEDEMYTLGYQSTDTSIIPTDASCFSYNSDTGYITNYDINCPKDVIIPAYINGKKITTIASKAFQNKGLESVLMPETITYISVDAFNGNNITTVGLSEGLVSIISSAFVNNKLTEITFPDSITSIDGFKANQLAKITFGSGLTTIENSAFADNPNLVDVDFSRSTSLTSIGNQSFARTGLVNITFPDSLVTILPKAFQNTKLTSITIPESVTKIEMSAFAGTKLSEINIVNKTSLDDFEYLGTGWNGGCTNINFISK